MRKHVPLIAALIVFLAWSGAAHAAGSNMPWEAPLTAILESIEGPVARIIAVIIIIITGLSLAFGDTSGGFRRLIQIVFGHVDRVCRVLVLPVVLQLLGRRLSYERGPRWRAGVRSGVRSATAPLADRADPAGRRAAHGGDCQWHAWPRPWAWACNCGFRAWCSGSPAMRWRSGARVSIRGSMQVFKRDHIKHRAAAHPARVGAQGRSSHAEPCRIPPATRRPCWTDWLPWAGARSLRASC